MPCMQRRVDNCLIWPPYRTLPAPCPPTMDLGDVLAKHWKLLAWFGCYITYTIGSMYGSFTYFYHKNQPNVGQCTGPMHPWVSWNIPKFCSIKRELVVEFKYYPPPRKLTWQWKIHHLKVDCLLTMWILPFVYLDESLPDVFHHF